MHLSEVLAENFRIFGSLQDGKALQLALKPGLNVLVGENDGGKSAIIDAIRYCLWTTSQDYHRFTSDDFHCDAAGRRAELRIRCKFADLSTEDQASFMEWLTTTNDGNPVLYIHLRATRLDGKRQDRVSLEVHSGEDGDGPTVEGAMRELLKTTYLKPLRDAETELSPGRSSRLSQILGNHPGIASEGRDDFDPTATGSGTTLVGIMKRAEYEIGRNAAVLAANKSINDTYLGAFQLGPEPLTSEVGVAGDTTLSRILEKLELAIAKPSTSCERTRRGLGYNNALFMSAELLLLGTREAYPTLLIEEPEAHLHPQMQTSVITLLNAKTSTTTAVPQQASLASDADSDDPTTVDAEAGSKVRPVQVLMTTHSPNIASSVQLDKISVVTGGRVYSLGPETTRLAASDYAFLERFLDVTKANLFFARGVAIVEGDAENLLLPALAEKVGYSLKANGVSVVSVGHTGLFRYGNIFRRQDGTSLPIRVACLRDRDIVPDRASGELRKKLPRESDFNVGTLATHIATLKSGDGESVETFVSDRWTFEYDLAAASWETAKLMHAGVSCAKQAETKWPDDAKITSLRDAAFKWVEDSKAAGTDLLEVALDIYTPLRLGNASKAIAAQFTARFVPDSGLVASDLPAYLVDALKHLTGV